ncbi:MAG: tRNA (N6-isopentenyl adenosine(37)-C2)-methylthiotransferase MiaB [Clostridia bacterium]|nr:tRNA (N6-isopentenyl adenosine(37)-C2)-methylthiotransferase MiaB [Clostridiales bacterium]MBQ6804802.1 tRNA (N6-isopentenyl adenosine(37)-C2)-methylthiotransferase MiaB [Clostridia bacterium]
MREEVTIRISPEEIAAQQQFAREFSALDHRPKTYFIVTYGCQMNAHDSEKLSGMLESMGMTQADCKENADFVLHNTCCIRDNAERKALGNVTWLKEIKKERPELMIGVCGCMVQEPGMAEKILRQYPFVEIAFGTGNIHRLPELMLRAVTTRRRVVSVPDEQSTVIEGLPIRRESPFQSYVTIMYGCNNFCSYCIVPYVRGRERSRNADDILREVEGLQKQGVQEIMLLGQNVNSYGNDMENGISFPRLLHKIGETGIPRIRFMTSHPKDLSDELIEEMAVNPALCRHLHLPVQAGNNRILAAMNRRYTREQYLEKVNKIRAAVPDIGLTTDLIVAFPGETEAEFEDTMDLVRTVGFDSAFTFIYSPRVGTRAAEMPGRIDPAVATQRIEKLIALQEEMTQKVFASLVGTNETVLVTGHARRNENQLTGKCSRNISVNFEGPSDAIGKILPIHITAASKTTLRGEILKGD